MEPAQAQENGGRPRQLGLRSSFTPLPFTFPEPSKFTFNLLNYPSRQIYSEPKTAGPTVSSIYFPFTPRGSHLVLIYSTPPWGIYFSFTLKGSDCLLFYFSRCFTQLTPEC